jgi:lipoprotein-releasing system permease protein
VSLPYFIAKRLLKSEVKGKKVSRPIVRISMISIALAVVVNLITIAVVTGFQHEVRNKVTGFGAHLTLLSSGENSIYESAPIYKEQSFYPSLAKEKDIAGIYYFGYKPILLQSDKTKRRVRLSNGKDTILEQQEIHGALLKGVDKTYDLSFYKRHLKEGRLPRLSTKEPSEEIILSKRICRDLNLKLGTKVRAFFVKNQPVKRMFRLVGIYETGLEEFDKKIIIGDIRHVQELNDWGINASVEIDDTLYDGQLIVRGVVNGSSGRYLYNWGEGFDTYTGFTICPSKDTIIRLIAAEWKQNDPLGQAKDALKDTAFLKIKVKKGGNQPCNFMLDDQGELVKNFLNETGSRFMLTTGNKKVEIEYISSPGSGNQFVGGFEVSVKDWDQLDEVEKNLKAELELVPTKHNEQLQVQSIKDTHRDIFVWLGFLDINVVIILTLMLLIGIINMGSALLVLILVKSNFVGVMKAMGASDWTIRKVFLWQAGFLIVRGMLIGNAIGLGICGLQYFFGLIHLNPEVYYLDKVPIELSFTSWALLNLATLIVCVSALIIPSVVITRIQPAKSIRFH